MNNPINMSDPTGCDPCDLDPCDLDPCDVKLPDSSGDACHDDCNLTFGKFPGALESCQKCCFYEGSMNEDSVGSRKIFDEICKFEGLKGMPSVPGKQPIPKYPGCSVSADCKGNIIEFILPYIGLGIVMAILKMRDARKYKACK